MSNELTNDPIIKSVEFDPSTIQPEDYPSFEYKQ